MRLSASTTLKVLTLTLIYGILLTWLLLLLCSRYQYQNGITHFKLERYGQAIESFYRAKAILPEKLSKALAPRDLFRINTGLGKSLLKQAMKIWKETGEITYCYGLLLKSSSCLTAATTSDPLSYRTAYWMARTESALEYLYPLVQKTNGKNPYNALPLYKKAAALRPSGITVRLDMARYLYNKGMTEALPPLVEYMAEIYPPAYYSIKKEPYYTKSMDAQLEKGMQKALSNKTLPRETNQALSTLAMDNDDLPKAIQYYTEVLADKSHLNNERSYLQMGRLLLMNNETNKSFEFFIKTLHASKAFEETLNQVYRTFKNEKKFTEFINFTSEVEQAFKSSQALDYTIATCWIDTGKLELAKARLLRMNASQPSGRTFYLLAQIAKQQKNWNDMELFSQRAVVLNAKESDYHYLFAQALNHQKKTIQAEQAITDAINCSEENPWYYHYRARLRWHQNNYKEAIIDWKQAAALKPDYPDFLYNISQAYWKLEKNESAKEFARKALKLSPNQKKYNEWKTKIDNS